MSERLRASDLALLAEETPQTPMHNATLEIFDPGELRLRLRHAARAHRRPDRLRAALPAARSAGCPDGSPTRSGSTTRTSTSATTCAAPRCRGRASLDQLRELTARIMSRRLDPDRPLWEVYFVEGLEGGRVALLSKSHQILVDGIATVDLGQVLLDVDPGPRELVQDGWVARRRADPGRRSRSAPSPSPLRDPRVADHAPCAATPRRSARTLGSAAQPGWAVARRRPPVATAPRRSRRSTSSPRPSAGWCWCAPRSRTTARSAGSTAAPSTTSSWPPWPARSGPG